MKISDLTPAVEPIAWERGHLRLLDQRALPLSEKWLDIHELGKLCEAIKSLAVRGAPLLGITAAYGLVLGLSERREPEITRCYRDIRRQIARTRPTARNLFDSLELADRIMGGGDIKNPEKAAAGLLELARKIHDDERRNCHRIAEHGLAAFGE